LSRCTDIAVARQLSCFTDIAVARQLFCCTDIAYAFLYPDMLGSSLGVSAYLTVNTITRAIKAEGCEALTLNA
jgi:hypothetical protein